MNNPETGDTQLNRAKRRFSARIPTFAGLLPHSGAWLLLALVVFFVTLPVVQKHESGRAIETGVMTLFLALAVLAVGGSRQTLWLAVFLALPAIVGRWSLHFWSGPGATSFFVGGFLVFITFVVSQFLRFILRAPRVNSEVLCTAVSTYLLLSLLWATAYVLAGELEPNAFSGLPVGRQPMQGFDALYFSVVTLTTVGYGDIAPVSGLARMLAMMEALTGTLYIATLIARLVSVYSAEVTANAGKH